MPTTIITKFGSRAPLSTEIEKAELAIDLVNSILYTKDGNGTVKQLGGGTVKWGQLIEIPIELINLIDLNADGYIDVKAIQELAEKNEIAIGTLQTDLAALTGRVTVNESNIGTNSDRLDALEALTSGDGGYDSQIADILTELARIEQLTITNKNLSESNYEEIETLKTLVDSNLTGLVFGGDYDADQNKVENASKAGADAGLVDGENVPANSSATKGIYLVITTGGILSGTNVKLDGETANVGDWLVSDGIHGWIHLELGNVPVTFSMVGGKARDNADLEAELDLKMDADGATISCGNYS